VSSSSTTPIRVTHLITSLEIGGAQRMLTKLLERMDPDAFPSRVVALVGGGALTTDLERLGIQVEDLGLRSGSVDPRALPRLRKILRADPPDVLQTWLYHADILGALVARWAGIGTLCWNLRCTHGVAPGRSFAARAAPRLCASLAGVPEVIVTNSSAGRASHEALGYRARRWIHLPNGFDLERFAPAPEASATLRRELDLAPEAILCGVVARWHPMKNLESLPALAKRLSVRVPDLHFVLAGEGLDGSNEVLSRAIREAGAANRLHRLGARRDVPFLMAAFDFLLLASTYYEGFPNVLGEALASGTPCVTTSVGDAATIVGDAGFVAAPDDLEELAEAVARMALLGSEARAALGLRGRRSVAERFEIGAVVESYAALYRELVGQRSPHMDGA